MPTDQRENQSINHLRVSREEKSKGRLLLVEDHDVNRILIQTMTESLGYNTQLAMDGAEAVAVIDDAYSTDSPIDLVLMDVQMPFMDGYEATRMIRASGVSGESLPIVAITANAYKEDVDCCFASGMQDHIAKPVMIPELQKMLSKWIPDRAGEVADQASLPPSSLADNDSYMSEDLDVRYLARRDQAMSSLASLVRIGTFSDRALKETCNHLHDLIGTAALFGEAELGAKARQLEKGIISWKLADRPKKIRKAVADMMVTAQHGRPA
ncbi:response regulator [Parasphingorhabdus cellanae]|uniref:Response regulator n=1 Tax=Parasphingorhabdus cellanae TaxID=2806553 RepID=A0ABX7T6S9_9SPHN|nr:response regulator [Parasphingorhabdus cellanae]QTD56222.1 response regulator [Parasphingorhabdus cellanae]